MLGMERRVGKWTYSRGLEVVISNRVYILSVRGTG